MNMELTPTFDYTQVDGDKQARLQVLAEKGRMHIRRTQEELLLLHDVLWEAKSLLPHGAWIPWLRSELNIGQSGAWKIMHPRVVDEETSEIIPGNDLLQIAAPQLSKEQRVREMAVAARHWFLLILAIGQKLSEAKQIFMQRYPEHWVNWLKHEHGLSLSFASLFITVYEVYLMYPDKTPEQLLPTLLDPMEIISGYFLLGIKRLFFEDECSKDEWPVKQPCPDSKDPEVLGQWVIENNLVWPLEAFRLAELKA